ncbi:hypothetical protein BSKO_13535 [Bryopsis sp. KO-2023]|nr:hypothetical protein BSKO_13535 [Bryopsis sp. KO-2023]
MSSGGGYAATAATLTGTCTTEDLPSQGIRDFCFTPDVERQSIVNRRLRSFTYITKDTREENHRKEQELFERRAKTYRTLAKEQHHNSRPFSQGHTFWDNGKIVDRGRGKGTFRQNHGTYNPITNEWVVPPRGQDRPSTTQPSSAYRRQKSIADRCTLGEYNPVLHVWDREPVQTEQKKRDRHAHISNGFMTSSGHKARVACPQGVFDPIKADWIKSPPANTKLQESAGTLKMKSKRNIQNGETWGQHDPISGDWQVAPLSLRYRDQERVALEEAGVVTRGRHHCALPPDQGVYDPIQNEWAVLPENTRLYEGLTFSPVSKHSFR